MHVPYLSVFNNLGFTVLFFFFLQYSLMAVLIVNFTGLVDLRERHMEKFSHTYRYTFFKIEIHRMGNSQKFKAFKILVSFHQYGRNLWRK